MCVESVHRSHEECQPRRHDRVRELELVSPTSEHFVRQEWGSEQLNLAGDRAQGLTTYSVYFGALMTVAPRRLERVDRRVARASDHRLGCRQPPGVGASPPRRRPARRRHDVTRPHRRRARSLRRTVPRPRRDGPARSTSSSIGSSAGGSPRCSPARPTADRSPLTTHQIDLRRSATRRCGRVARGRGMSRPVAGLLRWFPDVRRGYEPGFLPRFAPVPPL